MLVHWVTALWASSLTSPFTVITTMQVLALLSPYRKSLDHKVVLRTWPHKKTILQGHMGSQCYPHTQCQVSIMAHGKPPMNPKHQQAEPSSCLPRSRRTTAHTWGQRPTGGSSGDTFPEEMQTRNALHLTRASRQ